MSQQTYGWMAEMKQAAPSNSGRPVRLDVAKGYDTSCVTFSAAGPF